MPKVRTTTALITGATGGMGEWLCREFAAHRHNLVITARKRENLEELARRLRRAYEIEVTAIPADLNQPECVQNLFCEIRDSGIEIDFLVNNAGFGMGGYFFQNRLKAQNAMINVNILAPTRLCRMFLPGMLSRGSGRILNVSSTGAFAAGPYNSVYCASKAYVLSVSEAMGEEIRDSGVTVSTLCPGATSTGFAGRAGMETTRLFNYCVMSPRDVARRAYAGMMAGEKIIVPGIFNKALLVASRLTPRCSATKFSGFLQRRFTCRNERQ